MQQHLSQLQTILYDVLQQDTSLGSHITGIYDGAPENATFPYITLSELIIQDVSSRAIPLSKIDIALNIWSRYQGRRELYDISARLDALITVPTLRAAGATMLVHCQKGKQHFMPLAPQRIMQSTLSYHVIMEGTL